MGNWQPIATAKDTWVLMDVSAFWLYPDWGGPSKEPFWMRRPRLTRADVPEPSWAKRKRWRGKHRIDRFGRCEFCGATIPQMLAANLKCRLPVDGH